MMRKTLGLFATLCSVLLACGAEFESSAIRRGDEPLVGGEYTYDRPEVGSVWINGNLCTATLVGPQLVLTAAHCIEYRSHEDAWQWGSFMINAGESVTHWYTIRRMAAFMTGASDESLANDLALLELDTPVPSSVATPVRLSHSEPAYGAEGTLYGYGCQQRGQDGRVAKQKVSVRWGDTTTRLCPGDSGGPTIMNDGTITRVNSAYNTVDGHDIFAYVFRRVGDIEATATRWGAMLGSPSPSKGPAQNGMRYFALRVHLPTETLNSQLWVVSETGDTSYVTSPAEYGRYGIAADESNVTDVPWPNRAFSANVELTNPDEIFWAQDTTASGIDEMYPQVPASATAALRAAYAARRIVPRSAVGYAVLLQQGIYVP